MILNGVNGKRGEAVVCGPGLRNRGDNFTSQFWFRFGFNMVFGDNGVTKKRGDHQICSYIVNSTALFLKRYGYFFKFR